MKVGIIGSGQLGLMMILEGKKLGIEFNVIEATRTGPASRIADRSFVYDEYRSFVDESDVVTYEFEHVDERPLTYANDEGKLRPGLKPVELKRDRSLEKLFLRQNGLPVGDFKVALGADEATEMAENYGDAVIKSAFGGYDGKGQYFVRDGVVPASIPEGKYVVEEFVDFDMEASVIGSRSGEGEKVFHEPSLNVNRHGMLYYNIAPVQDFGMKEIVSRLLDKLGYIGVMGVEFFIKDGKAYINEFAPRVHNTGHHTLMGSSMSQFEQHIRVICGYPVTEPILYRPSGILNIVGKEPTSEEKNNLFKTPETQFFWYAKNGVRKRRKVGHINVSGQSYEEVEKKIMRLSMLVYGGNPDQYFTEM